MKKFSKIVEKLGDKLAITSKNELEGITGGSSKGTMAQCPPHCVPPAYKKD